MSDLCRLPPKTVSSHAHSNSLLNFSSPHTHISPKTYLFLVSISIVFGCTNILTNGDGSKGTDSWSYDIVVKAGSDCGGLAHCFSVGTSGTSLGGLKLPYAGFGKKSELEMYKSNGIDLFLIGESLLKGTL